MREVLVKAGERRRILHLFSDSIPRQVQFSATPENGAGEVGGTVEVIGSWWLFRKPPLVLALRPHNSLRKGMFDSLYSVSVIPDRDVRIRFESRFFTSRSLAVTLAVVLALAIVAAAGTMMFTA